MTSPEVERAVLCVYRERKWARGRLNPRPRFFRPPLFHLSYQGQQKKPDVAYDTLPPY